MTIYSNTATVSSPPTSTKGLGVWGAKLSDVVAGAASVLGFVPSDINSEGPLHVSETPFAEVLIVPVRVPVLVEVSVPATTKVAETILRYTEVPGTSYVSSLVTVV